MANVIVDTGAIVGLLRKNDQWRDLARETFEKLEPPEYRLVTCEGVIAEACFLLRQTSNGVSQVFELLSKELIELDFALSENIDSIKHLAAKYRSVPMSFTDACLVRMSETNDAPVFTFDSDFRVYRRHGNKRLELIGLQS